MTTTTTTVTPYAAANIVNAALEEAELDVRIPPQMMYNYTSARLRKGKNPFIKTTLVDNKPQVDVEDLARWTEAYVAKKLALTTTS
jgi:hypothetical protein